MTTIAALHIPGRGTVIGADSQYTICDRAGYLSNKTTKIVTCGGWAITSSGALRNITILDAYAKTLFEGLDCVSYLPGRIAQVLDTNGYKSDCEEQNLPCYDAAFLVANAMGVWFIDPMMGLVETEDNVLCASGSGADYALAADYVLRDKTNPIQRVSKAIETACALDTLSGGRIDLFESKASIKNDPEFRRVS